MALYPHNAPDVEGGGQGEHQTGKQDGWRGELKLAMFAIFKIRGGHLDEKQDDQHYVNDRKYALYGKDRISVSAGGRYLYQQSLEKAGGAMPE